MQKFILPLTCCVTLLSIPTITRAKVLSGNLGLSIPRNCDVKDSTMPATVTFEDDEGFALEGAVGYILANTREEGEIAYKK